MIKTVRQKEIHGQDRQTHTKAKRKKGLAILKCRTAERKKTEELRKEENSAF